MQPTFAAFEETMAQKLPAFQAALPPGIIVEKVIVDPDELLAYAKHRGIRAIDSKTRSEFAAFLVMQKYGNTQ